MPKKDKKITKSKSSKKIVKKVSKSKIVESVKKEDIKVEKTDIKKEETSKRKSHSKYVFSVGRRKSSVARIRLLKDNEDSIIINNKDYKKYFPYFELQKIVTSPLESVDYLGKGTISIKVIGGGVKSQSESIRHGIARALVKVDQNFRPVLKKNGFLTRDSRVKERKKYGLRGARRAPQWQKR